MAYIIAYSDFCPKTKMVSFMIKIVISIHALLPEKFMKWMKNGNLAMFKKR